MRERGRKRKGVWYKRVRVSVVEKGKRGKGKDLVEKEGRLRGTEGKGEEGP